MSFPLAIVLFVIALAVLFKSADFFVDGAVGVANILSIPKMIVGIVLVGFCTTAPEFTVSVISALDGHPEMALGNAVGSVVCDDALALALAALVAPMPILINRGILKSAGIFLLFIGFLCYGMSMNGTVGRMEGGVLVLLLVAYFASILFFEGRKLRKKAKGNHGAVERPSSAMKPGAIVLKFALGLIGVIGSSWIVVKSAETIAGHLGVPEAVIALSMVAFGTSLPEIITCVTAARKGEGKLAVGNIIGADILNLLWIVGISSLVNPITVDPSLINFMFPSMLVVVVTMLFFLRLRYRIWRVKGVILLIMYGAYLTLMIFFFFR